MSIDTLPTHHSTIPQERIAALQSRWDEALPVVLGALFPGSDLHDDPETALEQHSQRRFSLPPNATPIIGIAGPGAAGKGTLGAFLQQELGFGRIINTTTREQRALEVHGDDYFFVDDDSFSTQRRLGAFALHLSRPGRGMYGIGHDEIASKLSSHPQGCIVEENPENLQQLLANISQPNVAKILLYILPKQPIIESAIGHLQHRLSLESDPAKQLLTPEVFESTLGDRQIDEFEQLATLPNHPSITPLFVVNDDLPAVKQLLLQLFKGCT